MVCSPAGRKQAHAYSRCTPVFDLPHELLLTLQLKDPITLLPQSEIGYVYTNSTKATKTKDEEDQNRASTACGLCGVSFQTLSDQKKHVKSDWHGYNLKQKLRGLEPVNDMQFEKLVEDLDESISGSDSSDTEDDGGADGKESTLIALLKRQAKLQDTQDVDSPPERRKRGSGTPPLIWFSSSLLATNVSLGIYRALFTELELQQTDLTNVLHNKQLKPAPAKALPTQSGNNGVPLPLSTVGPTFFLCMIGGGHFAAMIVSLTPKIGKRNTGVEERQAIVIAHKTFHRYTTRRKQGGSQSANDSAKGAAHSAGAGIRRYNEAALETEVRALLSDWKEMIDKSQLLFVRATGTTNRRTLFGPYEGQVLRHNDARNRTFPFSTRRATQAELMRAFVELTRMKISEVDTVALAQAAAAEAAKEEHALNKAVPTNTKPTPAKVSKEEETALLHTSQLQALIKRSKAPGVLSYIAKNSLPSDFTFYPLTTHTNHHASTPLHLAASVNSAVVISALLTKGNQDPTVLNGEGKPPFDLAGDRATRDAFRVARSELGEDRWNWDAAHVPSPITKAEADKTATSDRAELEKAETERRKAELERLNMIGPAIDSAASQRSPGKALGITERTGAELREQEARGLTPEMRAKLERERRARAAEERIRRMAGGLAGGGAGR
jgi:hypothetical protein